MEFHSSTSIKGRDNWDVHAGRRSILAEVFASLLTPLVNIMKAPFITKCLSVHDLAVSSEDSDMSDVSTASQPIGGSKANVFWGWFFLLCGSVSFLGFLFAAIIFKLIPQSGNRIISAIQNDRYYCFLVPLTLPVLVVAVYFHWLSMKLFKHA